MPKAFHVTLYNGSRDNNEEPHIVFISKVCIAQLLGKQSCVVFTESHVHLQKLACCTALCKFAII